jgi:two-component system LytT family response regulator
MIRCIVIDDKPLAIDILKAYIDKIPFLELVYATQNPLEALDFIHNNPVDLAFLDIQMPELNGIQLIRVMNPQIKTILTTAYSEFALEGYEHDVIDYLLKPIPFDRFVKAAEKARQAIEVTEPASLFVKTAYKIQRIPLDSILYLEARQNYVAIVTPGGLVMSLQNFKSMEERLPPAEFVRVHKSYIVAVNKINTVEKSRIKIGKTSIPIGDSYRISFFRRIGTI